MKFPMQNSDKLSTIRKEQTCSLRYTKKKKKKQNTRKKYPPNEFSSLYLKKGTPPLGCFIKIYTEYFFQTTMTSTYQNKIPPRINVRIYIWKTKRHYCGASPNIYRINFNGSSPRPVLRICIWKRSPCWGCFVKYIPNTITGTQCNIPRATTLTT